MSPMISTQLGLHSQHLEFSGEEEAGASITGNVYCTSAENCRGPQGNPQEAGRTSLRTPEIK